MNSPELNSNHVIRDIDIWRCANELIKQYGELADIEAAARKVA